MSDIWAACAAAAEPRHFGGDVLRLVESQEQVATNRLVATLAEQELLETLLEASKPPRPARTTQLDYLLATAFRYPPLRHGSRFGGRHEPSLFYGARTLTTVLAESAYYRFVFWQGMHEPPPAPLRTQHTLFGARIRARRGFALHLPPFDAYREELTSRSEYAATQALGRSLRDAGADAIEYVSARDAQAGLNVALFTPAAFAQPRPISKQEWLCETRAAEVSFYARGDAGLRTFPLSQFTVDSQLPTPAT
ncbi:MAG: RES family NAD+ phosphorylase [Steroidobacteraceae bacterium]